MARASLTNQVAIITGASNNIGLSIARRLAAEGAKVALTDLNENDVKERARELVDIGHTAIGFAMDVTDQKGVESGVRSVSDKFGTIDILVNNAAVFSSVSVIELDSAELDRVMSVNLKGTLYCAQAAAPIMIRNGGGRIINISSLAGKRGRTMYGGPGESTHTAYSVSKAAVIALTKAMAWEWAPHHVYVNSVSPGNIFVGHYDETQKQRLERVVPVGHTGVPEDVAHAVAFLASPEISYITGEVIDVDGGVLMD